MSGVPGFQRRSPRVETSQKALLIDSNGDKFDVTVIELSSGGFRLAVGKLLTVGEKIKIHVSNYGEFPGEIRWATEDQAGGVFSEPIDLQSL